MAEPGSARSAEPRAVAAGRGLAWWSEAWQLFTAGAGMWVALLIVLFIVFTLLGLVPMVGGLATALLVPVFAGSLMLTARKAAGGAAPEAGDLFAACRNHLNPLLVLGALNVTATLLLGGLATALGLGAVVGVIAGGANSSPGAVMAALGAGMAALFVLLVLGLVLAMALWFAPSLVVFRGTPPVAALGASLRASLKNIAPFTLYGLAYIAAAILATIPLGLGWIVLVPVLVLTVYTSYRDVFGDDAPPSAITRAGPAP